MTQTGSDVSPGWSLQKYEGAWLEEQPSAAAFTDSVLEVELERDGDTVSLTARSSDRVAYHGDYRYREGSNSNGEASFVRYDGPAGAAFVGEWKESDAASGPWILVLGKSEK